MILSAYYLFVVSAVAIRRTAFRVPRAGTKCDIALVLVVGLVNACANNVFNEYLPLFGNLRRAYSLCKCNYLHTFALK